MPSYNNFKNEYRRRSEQDNVFVNPKIRTIDEISSEREEILIEWITFYRRNIHRFVEQYFEIKLFPYQILWLYLMGIYDSFVAIAARGTAKSWLVGVLACAKAVLYPGSKVVVVSSTKGQAGTIVEKIVDLRSDHPNLAREISNIVTNMNKWEVTFHNGSTIVVVASRDSSRGNLNFCVLCN
jgi:reverse gyrase